MDLRNSLRFPVAETLPMKCAPDRVLGERDAFSATRLEAVGFSPGSRRRSKSTLRRVGQGATPRKASDQAFIAYVNALSVRVASVKRATASKMSWVAWMRLDGVGPLLKAVINTKAVRPGIHILLQGNVPSAVHALLEGQAYRYRLLEDGRRQIVAILVPGDICDFEAVMRGRADYGVATMTDCVLGELPVMTIADLRTIDSEFAQALWGSLLRDHAIAREWLVNVGCRTAQERVAHLICEFHLRLKAVGLTKGDAFKLQMTQAEIGDLLGLSTVHINRTLKQLRKIGLVDYSKSIISILDIPGLERVAGFDPIYLKML